MHPYDARLSLSPKLWLPLLGQTHLGFWTFGQDALSKHRYWFSFAFDWETLLPSYDFRYENHQSLPTLLFELEKKRREPGQSQQESSHLASIVLPLARSLSDQVNLSLTYRRWELNAISRRVGAELSWAHQRGFDLWQNTWTLFVGAETIATTGDVIWRNQVSFGIEDTLRLPLETTHTVALRAIVGLGEKEKSFLVGGESGRFALRGFKSGTLFGKQAFAGSFEYVFPMLSIERRLGLWPVFIDDVNGMVFVEAGAAGNDLSSAAIKTSVGGELQCSFVLAYTFSFTVHVGAVWRPGATNLTWYGRVSDLRF